MRGSGCALGGDRLATTVCEHRSGRGAPERFFYRAADVAGNYRRRWRVCGRLGHNDRFNGGFVIFGRLGMIGTNNVFGISKAALGPKRSVREAPLRSEFKVPKTLKILKIPIDLPSFRRKRLFDRCP